MAKRHKAEDAYGLNWITVQYAWDVMRAFAYAAQEDEGDPELRGAGKSLEDALEHIKNYYLPLAQRD